MKFTSLIWALLLLSFSGKQIDANEPRLADSPTMAGAPSLQKGSSEALACFRRALISNSVTSFDSILDKHGFAVIRNFTSGSLGGRGKNIRNFYPAPISRSFQLLTFPVAGETPVKLSVMFHDFRKMALESVSVFSDSIAGFGFQDAAKTIKPPTNKVIENLSIMASRHRDVSAPYVTVINNRYLVLAEGEIADNICTGYYAIFALEENDCFLRAVIDLR